MSWRRFKLREGLRSFCRNRLVLLLTTLYIVLTQVQYVLGRLGRGSDPNWMVMLIIVFFAPLLLLGSFILLSLFPAFVSVRELRNS